MSLFGVGWKPRTSSTDAAGTLPKWHILTPRKWDQGVPEVPWIFWILSLMREMVRHCWTSSSFLMRKTAFLLLLHFDTSAAGLCHKLHVPFVFIFIRCTLNYNWPRTITELGANNVSETDLTGSNLETTDSVYNWGNLNISKGEVNLVTFRERSL